MLNNEIETIQFKNKGKKNQFLLIFENSYSNHEPYTNPITMKKNWVNLD
jgi:hypothetical protein